jgi:hypothetical protein
MQGNLVMMVTMALQEQADMAVQVVVAEMAVEVQGMQVQAQMVIMEVLQLRHLMV